MAEDAVGPACMSACVHVHVIISAVSLHELLSDGKEKGAVNNNGVRDVGHGADVLKRG